MRRLILCFVLLVAFTASANAASITVTLALSNGTTYAAGANLSDADANSIISAYAVPFPGLDPQHVYNGMVMQLIKQVVAAAQRFQKEQAIANLPAPSQITITPNQ